MGKLQKAFAKAITVNPDAPDYPADVVRMSENFGFLQSVVNGYAYALRDIHPNSNFPQPGGSRGVTFSREAIIPLLEMDGLVKVDTYGEKRPGHYRVALIMTPQTYRLVREDSDGGWSYKDGCRKPKRTDSIGAPISVPHMATWEDGSVFKGYFYVPKGGLRVVRMSTPTPASNNPELTP